METSVVEIADGIYRLSTYVERSNLRFNQYLIAGEEPLLFHCGYHALFPLVSEAVGTVMPVAQLRWICYGHHEGDESGALNEWLAAAPNACVAVGRIACMLSANDLAIRPPRALEDGEVVDLGGKRVRYLATPHVPHGWDAGLLFEETTGTLFCGDLFTQIGNSEPIVSGDIVGPALEAEKQFGASALTPITGLTMRGLAALAPGTLGLMHGPAFRGDGAQALRALADGYDELLREKMSPG